MARRRRTWGITTLLLCLALIAGACGGGDDDDAGDGESTNAPGEADTAEVQPGGTLTFALEAESSGGWCPVEAQFSAAGINVHNAIYDPLLIADENLEAQPYLAEEVTPNADFTQYTIKLRPNVKFHDGSPLTAAVVKLNLDLYRGEDAAVAETGRQPLLFPFVFSDITSVDVVDDLTLTVSMARSWPAWPIYLASGRVGIAAEAQLRSPDCAESPLGTGPFKFESWVRNQELITVKNPDYWRTDAEGRKLPYLDRLVFKPIESGVGRFQALEGGTVDAGQWSQQSVFDDIEELSDEFTLIKELPGHREVGYGLMNVSQPPFDNQEIREMMAKAIDRDALNDITNNGEFEIANQPFDSKVSGYVEELEGPEYDPEAAAEYFKDKGITFQLSYATDPNTKALAEDIQRQLKDVGVEITVDEKDQSTLINQALSGNFNVVLFRNHPGSDPDGQYVWWHTGQPVNFGKINDPELDQLLDEGRTTLDPAARAAIYQDVARLFAEKQYNMWNWYTEWGIGAANKVHQAGYYSLPDGGKGAGLNWGWTYFAEVWVEQ
ncbi:MAG TPA: ABC transporter substrate-binding protein [Microthrixaceae bacterium]|nr:ABC transporter substrate-binding protein [Microthrixaceae bacterium]